jgi:hypothetical protein
MTADTPGILSAVPIAVAAERTGLGIEDLLVLVAWEEPTGLDGVSGERRPVVRSYPSDAGILVCLADALEAAPAFRAIVAGGGRP